MSFNLICTVLTLEQEEYCGSVSCVAIYTYMKSVGTFDLVPHISFVNALALSLYIR